MRHAGSAESRSRRVGHHLLTLLVILSALAFTNSAYRSIRHAMEANQWPTTTAEIVSQRLREKEIKSGRRRQWYEYADIEYVFNVNGKTYQSDRLTHRDWWLRRPTINAKDALNELPIEEKFSVSYNPSDPNDCCIQPGLWWPDWADLGIATVLWTIFAFRVGLWSRIFGVNRNGPRPLTKLQAK